MADFLYDSFLDKIQPKQNKNPPRHNIQTKETPTAEPTNYLRNQIQKNGRASTGLPREDPTG